MRSNIFAFCIFFFHISVSSSFNNDNIQTSRYYSYRNRCSNYWPKSVRDEIAQYKVLVQEIMKVVTSNRYYYGDYFYTQYTKFMDKFGARLAGTENLENAIDYMINLTQSNAVYDITTEEVDVPHWIRGEERAEILMPTYKHIGVIGLGSSVSTPPDGITAEAIVVKSFKELEQMTSAAVCGKIVVFNAQFVSYQDTVAYRIHGATKAAEKGAIASLVRSITPVSMYTLHTGEQDYGDNVTKIPTAAITIEDADLLQRMYDRGDKIVIYLKMSNRFEVKKSRNTIIDLKGTSNPEKVVIVSGHIDSWDVGQGAIDDGGGMMVSWFVPVILKKLGLQSKRTIRSILWTSEENGLIGAAAYLKNHKHELKNINLIMESDEGTFKPLGLEVSGSQRAKCLIAEVLKHFSPIDKIAESNEAGSDIVLFEEKGVPGASLLNANERYFWYHHSEADTVNVQNKQDVIKCAAFWAAVSYVIADISVDVPRY